MKPTYLTFLLLIILFTSCKHNDYIPLTPEYLTACENGNLLCKPVEIKRKHPSLKHTAYFESDMEVTSISLFDSSYFNTDSPTGTQVRLIKTVKNYRIQPNKHFSLDCTNLPDGKYFVNILGIKKGYIFPIVLVSKR